MSGQDHDDARFVKIEIDNLIASVTDKLKHTRETSLILTKLEEAALWLRQYKERHCDG